jgi:hypothetical protein
VTVEFAKISAGKQNNFEVDAKEDTVRPYDMLSLMHYDATAFSTDGSATITAKPAAYGLYTNNSAEYHKYSLGNRVGMTQLDADQLAAQARAQSPCERACPRRACLRACVLVLACSSVLFPSARAQYSCTASVLRGVGQCVDKTNDDGTKWADGNGSDCDFYRSVGLDECKKYVSNTYCCGCDGGIQEQIWAQPT